MKLQTNIKERVTMFKRKQNDNINVIYRADEQTRRAIDDLYTRKADRNKAVAAVAIIALFIGLATGWYGTISHTFYPSSDTVVKIELADDLKAQPQSDKK